MLSNKPNRKKRYSFYILISTSIILLVFAVFFFETENVEEEPIPVKPKEYSNLKIDDSTEFLVGISTDSIPQLGSPIGFVNRKGDTIISIGKYSHVWTDTFKTYAIVYDQVNTNGETVAIDKEENILFDIVFFDNWPDESSEGLFRIKRNGKIGYADEQGIVKIPCVYECGFPFENGKAQVAFHCKMLRDNFEHTIPQSDEWFYIDKNGIKTTSLKE